MMGNSWRIAALALPVIGLGGLWAMSEFESRQGTFWDVPVVGYDPRDLLRGHYVEYRYDWPGWEEGLSPARLCIEGKAPTVTRVKAVEIDAQWTECEHRAEADFDSIYGDNSLLFGRIYVGQDRALEIEETVRDRDQRGIMRVRLAPDGRLVPVNISFRPLTANEIAARDREDEEMLADIPASEVSEP